MLLDDALVLSLSSNRESSFMTIQTQNDGFFTIAAWVGEHEHLSAALSLNFKNAPFHDIDYLSLVVIAFSCGRWNCVVLTNGTIIASSGSSGFLAFHDASIAAFDAFALDPRCSSSRNRNVSTEFSVRDAWMGDGEVMLHWGGGCYIAFEVLFDPLEPRVLISWAACVGTDIPRAPGTIQVYLGHGTVAVVSPTFQGSPACTPDGTPVPRLLIAGDISSSCKASASSSVNFSHITADLFFGELFMGSKESLETPSFVLALLKIPWRQHLPGPTRHISESNISLIPNMVQTRPMCQLTGVIATSGYFWCRIFVLQMFIFTLCFIPVRYPPHAGMYSEELLLRAWQLRPCWNDRPAVNGVILLIDWLALEHNIIHSRCRNFDMYVFFAVFSEGFMCFNSIISYFLQ